MSPCTHLHWLRVHQEDENFTLQYGNRLQFIADSMPNPKKQYPSVVFFIGKQVKTKVMRSLFPKNCPSHQRNGLASIEFDPATVDSDYPLLIAHSCSDLAQLRSRPAKDICHTSVDYQMVLPNDGLDCFTRKFLITYTYAKLFSPFIHVLCIFAEDCGGLDGVIERLEIWFKLGCISSLPASTHPRLVITTNIPEETFDQEALRFKEHVLSDRRFLDSFASLNMVNIFCKKPIHFREHISVLLEVLHKEILLARAKRQDTYTLFSMTHFAAFFEKSLHQFAQGIQQKFDFIKASREDFPVSPDFEDHLACFLDLATKGRVPRDVFCDFLASAILLDNFPPDMHLFDLSQIFHTLYREICLDALYRNPTPDLICAEIEAHVISLFTQAKAENITVVTLRQKTLSQSEYQWQQLHSNITCLSCLQRKPEHVLNCGHGVCDVCVEIFGAPAIGMEYYYKLDACPICQLEISFQARLLPPTCRVRFLGVDGGGSRGVVPLAFIGRLEKTLDLPYPIQEHFDFAIGTSSGGLVILALFAKYWNPKKCLNFFHKFAKKIFPPRAGITKSIYATVKRIFTSYMVDGKYDAEILEAFLKEAFGMESIFAPVKSRPSGMKYAVTATTINDASLCLISNYNGEGSEARDIGPKHLRIGNKGEEIFLWEAARCTTAAPTYFKPKQLHSFGTFQDGGLKYNNPVRPGLREIRRVWKNGDCDVVLSVGTGFEQKSASPIASDIRNLLQDGPLARLYRASMESLSLNSQNNWEDHWYGLEEDVKKHHFRLNVPIIGKEPAIDDIDQMQYLEDQVQRDIWDFESIARAFKAVSFFFELDQHWKIEGGIYKCRGSILSRSPDNAALIRNLLINYSHCEFFINNFTLGNISEIDICKSCGHFRKAVAFDIRHPSDVVKIDLIFNRQFRWNISGFPQSMIWVANQQKLNHKFGWSNHRNVMMEIEDTNCHCKIQRYIVEKNTGKRKRDVNLRSNIPNKLVGQSAL